MAEHWHHLKDTLAFSSFLVWKYRNSLANKWFTAQYITGCRSVVSEYITRASRSWNIQFSTDLHQWYIWQQITVAENLFLNQNINVPQKSMSLWILNQVEYSQGHRFLGQIHFVKKFCPCERSFTLSSSIATTVNSRYLNHQYHKVLLVLKYSLDTLPSFIYISTHVIRKYWYLKDFVGWLF